MSVDIADQLIRIDPAFSQLKGFTGTPPLTTISPIIPKYSTYTTEQLDYLFNHLDPKDYRWWQNLVLKVEGLTPVPPLVIANDNPFKDLLEHPKIKALPSSYFMIRTKSGILTGFAELEFSVSGQSKRTSYSDKYWRRIICSMTIVPGSKWSGLPFVSLGTYTKTGMVLNSEPLKNMYTNATIEVYKDATYWDVINYVAKYTEMRSEFIPEARAKWLEYINAPTVITDLDIAAIVDSASICTLNPNICASEIQNYLQSNDFNSVSNAWCDSTGFTPANAAPINKACKIAYAKANCKSAANIYKSNFAVYPSNKLVFESFGGNCTELCKSATSGTELYDACKQGAIEFCKTGNNVTQSSCQNDIGKYPELATIFGNWCANNKSNPIYSSICPQQAPTNTPSTPVNVSSNTSNTPANAITKSNSDTVSKKNVIDSIANELHMSNNLVYVLLAVCAFVLISFIGGGIYLLVQSKKSQTTFNDMDSFHDGNTTKY